MKYLTILFIVLGCWSCQDVKYPEKPEDLIGKEKMVDILTEAYLANAAKSVGIKPMEANGIQIDSLLYTKFNVDSLQFARSNAFYAADVNVYISLFQEVEIRLQKMETELDSLRKSKRPK